MGVQGLKTFIESKGSVLQERRFRDSKLVIDGSNLFNTLYFSCNLDQAHGGDYDAFEQYLTKFFKNLQECNIRPYVIIDGGTDYTGKKFDTLLCRTKERIKKADDLSKGRPGQIVPPLSKNVFKQFLRNNNVPFVQCVAEADWEAAALANEWNCPVLSNDSDFFIFDIKEGFLPLSHFLWEQVSEKGGKFILAKMFYLGRLCSVYRDMNRDLLPICAALLGNDYIKRHKVEGSRVWQSFSTGSAKHRIDCLLNWLCQYRSPDLAISEMAKLIKNKVDSDQVSKDLNASLKDYRLTSSSIAEFFTSGNPQSNLPDPLKKVPEWMLRPLAEGKLNSIFIDVLVQQRLIMNFTIENFELPSSNQISLPIRKITYGLLLGGQSSASDAGEYAIEEYDRKGLELIKNRVAVANLPEYLASNLQQRTLHEVGQDLRRKTILETLQVSITFYRAVEKQVPDHLQLPVYITWYWMKNAVPKPKREFLWALLVGLVYGEMSRLAKTEVRPVLGEQSGDQKQLDLEVAHAYSQWQGCVRDCFCLNQLLDNPVPEPQCAWLYKGTLVHRLVSTLQRGTDPATLLLDSSSHQLFCKLRQVIEVSFKEDEEDKELPRKLERKH